MAQSSLGTVCHFFEWHTVPRELCATRTKRPEEGNLFRP